MVHNCSWLTDAKIAYKAVCELAKKFMCQLCKNQGLFKEFQGHKKAGCDFANCLCEACDVVRKTRIIQKQLIAERRKSNPCNDESNFCSIPETNSHSSSHQMPITINSEPTFQYVSQFFSGNQTSNEESFIVPHDIPEQDQNHPNLVKLAVTEFRKRISLILEDEEIVKLHLKKFDYSVDEAVKAVNLVIIKFK